MAGPVDLSHVRTFVLLYETRSVTATAQLLHVTQPTVSYSLSKLRRRFEEQLFVRTPTGLVPTATATALYEPLRAALDGIERAVGGAERFDPARSAREFTVMLSDFGELSFLPLILTQLDRRAPEARLRVRHLLVDSAADLLVSGQLDLVITSVPLEPARLLRRPFMEVDYAVLASRSHPRIRGSRLTAAAFARERYVSVTGTTGHLGPVELIRRLELEANVELQLSSFSAVPYVVAAGALLAIVPRHIGEIFAARHDVVVLDLPWRVEPIRVTAYTRRSLSEPQRWLADLVVETLSRERFA
jgi:DNA-binding transcriptional LysR family regulator